MKNLVTLTFLLFTATSWAQLTAKLTFSQPSDPAATVQYTGAVTNGKANGYGEAQFLKNGKPDGLYKGYWQDNDLNGKGSYTAANGDSYDGDWLNGLSSGKGVFVSAAGDRYEGDYKNGQPNGKGTKTWIKGAVYKGDWLNGQLHGKGLFLWAEGGSYNGSWVNGRKNGKGFEIWSSGDVYDGQWLDDQRSGQGVYYWANGDLYDGAWLQSQFHGYGRFITMNGNRDEGQYVSNVFKGTRKTQLPMSNEARAGINTMLQNAATEIEFNKGYVAYKTGKYTEALEWLTKAANKGHDEAKTVISMVKAKQAAAAYKSGLK